MSIDISIIEKMFELPLYSYIQCTAMKYWPEYDELELDFDDAMIHKYIYARR